ncbi:MAG: ATP-binding cassette domain-containing protein [Coriobacteriia bacterium]|nr:ATP-binding cassette domain-containing protein [Coriobacteriia bacterium]
MLELKNIRKEYTTGSFTQVALDDVSVSFRDSEFVAILGPSGSGKTTLLNVVGGLDHFDSGDLVIDGISTKDFRDRDWDAYRNNRIGFVFQSYNLIPHQTVLENVELALTLSGVGHAERRERAKEALGRVGLAQHVDKRPAQLSGGQMQRVAIARALINDPEIVLADEPTGALDSATSVQVMDLLKEVARDRLVIMVTHNPELAHEYATRIVTIGDGRVAGDTDPFAPDSAALREAKPTRRTSMSFLTALGLSARNLLTKKGRTAMTAFAGSIGIIGIAAILALSNGVNEYIAKVEEDTLSSYPLTISKQSYDMSSMLGDPSGSAAADSDDASSGDGSVDTSQAIPVFTAIKDMFASVKSNDMTSFKAWLDAGGDGMSDDVNSIQYDYGVEPIVYRESDDGGSPTKLLPNAMTEAMSTGMSSTVASYSGTDVFNEMIDDPELLESQYDVVAGRWAESADEAVLVLSSRGTVGDYTLYSIGALDINELNDLVTASLTSGEDVETPDTDVTFTYDDALGTSFKVLAASDAYRRNDETGGWTDMSDDEEYMASQVENGLDLRIVGVVKPNESASSNALSAGIAYTHGLTTALMERAAASEIAQQQLADPSTDVFTGKSFDELQEDAKKGVDLQSMFSVDEDALRSAFSFDESALSGLSGGLDLSGMDLSGVDLSGLDIDLSGISLDVDFSSALEGAPAPDFSGVFEGLELTPEQLQEAGRLANRLLAGFVGSDEFKALGDDVKDPEKVLAAFKAYLSGNDEAKALLRQIEDLGGGALSQRLQDALSAYMRDSFAPYLQQVMAQATEQLAQQIAQAVSRQVKAGMARALDQVATQMTEAMEGVAAQMSGSLAGLEDAFSVDADAFASAIHVNMDASDLSSLISSYAKASSLTYDNNLKTLGYADESDPQSVKIYPKDFEAKERVLERIDGYNAAVQERGEDDKAISYTDYVGVLMGSVTDIVNMISLVLIAFVSISLVVSSIMIGIITYISVLERKKEIGILRAIGASKRNVANVFNAETFIEGLISGVFAIVVVVCASFPVNAYVLAEHNVPNIMSLPWYDGALLIGVSVVLTVVAGLLPARSASKKDPVEALRSE